MYWSEKLYWVQIRQYIGRTSKFRETPLTSNNFSLNMELTQKRHNQIVIENISNYFKLV